MKLNINDFDFEEFEELPQKEKIVRKKKNEDKEKSDTYKKPRKRKDDLDVLF